MSGVEAAGFILAAFPLLISALEDYRKGWEILEDWWKIKREYKKCQQNIKLQKLVFEENLEQLLAPLVPDEDALRLLIAEPGGEAWANPALEEGLRERLPRSFEVYLEIIKEINGVMESLKGELGVDSPSFQGRVACEETMSMASSKDYTSSVRVRMDIKPNFLYQKQRIKFTFNKKPRNNLLDELAQYNNKLQKLLESSDRLAASRKTRRRTDLLSSARMSSFCEHAKNIYRLLKSAWQCDCLSLHQARLLLQHRTSPDVELRVSFIFAEDAKHLQTAPWICRMTKIKRVIKETAPTLMVPDHPSRPASKGSAQSLVLRPFLKSYSTGVVKGVRWEASELRSETSSMTAVEEPRVIKDMCTTIASRHYTCSDLGYLKDGEYQYYVYPITEQGQEDSILETVALESLLSKTSPIKLTRRQRYSIALTIASSHLQLHDTPWLGPQWSKKGILFHSLNGKLILTEEPYVSRDFLSTPPSPKSSYLLANHGMSTLGILLLELCFGIALEDHEIRRNFVTLDGQPNPGLDLVAAMQWCDRYANDEAGPEFAGAIDWCLRNPTARQSGAKEDAWREEIFTQVVEPLQYCHKQLTANLG